MRFLPVAYGCGRVGWMGWLVGGVGGVGAGLGGVERHAVLRVSLQV